MPARVSLSLVLALLAASGSLIAGQGPATPPQEVAGSALAWTDTAAPEKRLATHILQNLKGIDKASIQAFIAVPDNRRALALWHLVHAEKESSSRCMAEVLSSPAAANLFRLLAEDVNWLEQFAYSGECENPGRAMGIIAAIAKDFPELAGDGMARTIATATALEWARTGWDPATAPPRARFYIESDRGQRLHAGFRQLPFWQLRIICGCKADNPHGSVASLRWALDNVHLPIEQYTDCCWQASYLSDNLFGDSIHGASYYAPYSEVYGDNGMQRTREVGGVCGSLSHFGAFAALANGVPALTAGEPGHCAYIVLVKGRWTPAYSLSWQRGLHWQVWRGIHVFSSLHMASELHGEEQRERTALSNACRTLGLLHATHREAGKQALALPCLRAAVKTQPLNYLAWRDYAACARGLHRGRTEVWATLNRELCEYLVPRYPEMAAELLRREVYPHWFRKPPSEKHARLAFAPFWRALKGMGPDRWDIEALCDTQLHLLNKDEGNASSEAANQRANSIYSLIIHSVATNSAYAPSVLAWGNSKAAGMDKSMQQRFLRTTLSALGKSGKKGKDDAARDRLLAQAILGAERMRDRDAFQSIGTLLSPRYRTPDDKLPAWAPFPGKLVSQGGLLFTSSTCQHDAPASHWGVLEPVGGRFHTGNDKDAWAVVQLPKTATLSGVVTIAPGSNLWRLTGMKVQYSESGRDGDWHDAGALPDATSKRVNRLDLQGKHLRARYIRILRPGGPQYFHLNAIFVYGKPLA